MGEYIKYICSFIDYCKYHKNLSDKTIDSYNIDLKQYQEFAEELDKHYGGISNIQTKITSLKHWNCQEMCSQEIPKILNGRKSGGVMSQLC